MSTLAFTVCFMVWMMFAVLGVPIKDLLQLNETPVSYTHLTLPTIYSV